MIRFLPILFIVVLSGLTALAIKFPDSLNYDHMADANIVLNDTCSGTHIGDGYILTAAHCVRFLADGSDVNIKQVREGAHWVETTTTTGKVQWKDEVTDLAILWVPDSSIFATAEICRRDVVMGEKVVAFGNPAMLHDTMLPGVVNQPIRKVTIDRERLYFQINSGLVGGISGGAVYDRTGCLIGVAAASLQGTLMGAAVPVTLLPEDYKEKGSH